MRRKLQRTAAEKDRARSRRSLVAERAGCPRRLRRTEQHRAAIQSRVAGECIRRKQPERARAFLRQATCGTDDPDRRQIASTTEGQQVSARRNCVVEDEPPGVRVNACGTRERHRAVVNVHAGNIPQCAVVADTTSIQRESFDQSEDAPLHLQCSAAVHCRRTTGRPEGDAVLNVHDATSIDRRRATVSIRAEQCRRARNRERNGRPCAVRDGAADDCVARASDGERLGSRGAARYAARESQRVCRAVVRESVSGGSRAEHDAGIEQFVARHRGVHCHCACVVDSQRLGADSTAADSVCRRTGRIKGDRVHGDASPEADGGTADSRSRIECRRVPCARRGATVPVCASEPIGVRRASPRARHWWGNQWDQSRRHILAS